MVVKDGPLKLHFRIIYVQLHIGGYLYLMIYQLLRDNNIISNSIKKFWNNFENYTQHVRSLRKVHLAKSLCSWHFLALWGFLIGVIQKNLQSGEKELTIQSQLQLWRPEPYPVIWVEGRPILNNIFVNRFRHSGPSTLLGNFEFRMKFIGLPHFKPY